MAKEIKLENGSKIKIVKAKDKLRGFSPPPILEEEFNLSEKIWITLEEFRDDRLGNIKVEDVKEFIKKLKEEFEECRDKTDIWDDERWNKFEKMFIKKIDKLAGEKLI